MLSISKKSEIRIIVSIKLSNIHGAYNISKDIQENNENSQKSVILISKLT